MSVSIVLLCEDSQTDCFVRRFLRYRGFDHRDIQTLPIPHGRQSGEQWVRSEYPKELKAIRARQRAFLIVVIDADALTTQDRHSQLDRACANQGVPRRKSTDPALIVIPRRNIETWFEYLRGATVDETTTYPRLRRPSDCYPLARSLYRMCHEEQKLADPVPPSMMEARREYQRLKR